MALYRQIQTVFWQDEYVLDLNANEKMFYLWLLTNAKVNQIGCYKISKKVACIETCLNEDQFDKMLNKFTVDNKIKYDSSTSEVLVLNWHKHNKTTSPKVMQNMKVCIGYVINNSFQKYCIDTLSIPYKKKLSTKKYPIDTLSQDKKEDDEDNKYKYQSNNSAVDEKKLNIFFSHFGTDFWESDFIAHGDKEITMTAIRFICECLTEIEIKSLNNARFEEVSKLWFKSKNANHPNLYFRECYDNLIKEPRWFALGKKDKKGDKNVK